MHELSGLEGLQRYLLGLDHLVVLLDHCLGCLAVHVHQVNHLLVSFELQIDGPLLRARHPVLGSGTHVAGQVCGFF